MIPYNRQLNFVLAEYFRCTLPPWEMVHWPLAPNYQSNWLAKNHHKESALPYHQLMGPYSSVRWVKLPLHVGIQLQTNKSKSSAGIIRWLYSFLHLIYSILYAEFLPLTRNNCNLSPTYERLHVTLVPFIYFHRASIGSSWKIWTLSNITLASFASMEPPIVALFLWIVSPVSKSLTVKSSIISNREPHHISLLHT